ncbi:DNA primase small subunit isoform X2 [Hydra vulgaris]|uniref:DNA primase n=1 Tax=Hydra vulgaris TaxID=6087 RepID=A0ABM4C278_HYDVU
MNEKILTQQSYNESDLTDLLKQYYKRLFPYKLYYKWLQYGEDSKSYFENREFSFTLKDDIYIRYLSFADANELEKEMQKKVPYKIDIGAIYNYKPKDNKQLQAGVFKAEEKELVFDIDMTDYDTVRTCCSGASVCNKCWPLMTVALKILDRALEEDFGFEHRLWVYSGRRGIHCWVADLRARKLSQQGRSAVAEYLSVIKGGDAQAKKVHFKGNSLHPSIACAASLIKKYFTENYLVDQDILNSVEQQKIMLKLIPDESTRDKVEAVWNHEILSTVEKWKKLENLVLDKSFNNKHTLEEIMFQYVYPRLDINVTKGLNHLLKSPFCVHPKTGKVCVPIDPSTAENFDPSKVPTISQLFEELDEIKKVEATQGESQTQGDRDYSKTSLNEGIKIFERFVNGLYMENKENKSIYNNKKDIDW